MKSNRPLLLSLCAVLCATAAVALASCSHECKESHFDVVPPTCGETGVAEGTYCKKCDKTLSGREVIAPTAQHTMENGRCTVCQKTATEGLDYILLPDEDAYSVAGIGSVTEADVIIPATHDGKPVVAIEREAFQSCDLLTSVYIPEGVTRIGSQPFFSCPKLGSIALPSTVTSFEGHLSGGCNALTTISMAKGNDAYYVEGYCLIEKSTATVIGGCAQSQIPADIRHIGSRAFDGIHGLTRIHLPEGLENIGDGAFGGCENLENFVLPGTLKVIDINAFYSCDKITEIVIPEGLTEIGNTAFSGCDGLKRITIPSTVTKIDSHTFSGCFPDSLTVAEGNTAYTSVDNCLIETATQTLITVSSAYTVPADVKIIGSSAFHSCPQKSIVIPEGVEEIADGAFRAIDALEEITLPKSLKHIGEGAFDSGVLARLQTIHYAGREVDWNVLPKGEGWMNPKNPLVVQCSDKEIVYTPAPTES